MAATRSTDVHRTGELDVSAHRVAELDRLTLERPLEPAIVQVVLLAEVLGRDDVLVGAYAQADVQRLRGLCLLEHEAVVGCLFEAAQVDGVRCLLRHDQTHDVAVEVAAARQVGDGDHGVAGAGDRELGVLVPDGEGLGCSFRDSDREVEQALRVA